MLKNVLNIIKVNLEKNLAKESNNINIINVVLDNIYKVEDSISSLRDVDVNEKFVLICCSSNF